MVLSIGTAIPTTVAVDPQSNSTAKQPASSGTGQSRYSSYHTRQDELAQQVWPFRTEVQERFSQLHAWNDDHLFIEGGDGTIRRYPSAAEAEMNSPRIPHEMRAWPEMLRVHSMALSENHSRRIVDFSGPDRQAKVVAGYELGSEGQTARYELGGEPIASLVENRSIYALGAGASGESQYMVCQRQPEKASGGFACRDMLMSEGKSVAEVIALLGPHRMIREDRGTAWDGLIDEICDGWTDRPLVLRLGGVSSEKAMQQLKENLDARGAGILGFSRNIWVMLDSLEQVGPGHWTHRTRSPFHGSVVESHTVLGSADGQPGQEGSMATFGARDIDRFPLYLDLTDALVAIFRPTPLSAKGTQPPEDVVGIPV